MSKQYRRHEKRKMNKIWIVLLVSLLVVGGVVTGLNWDNWFGDSQTSLDIDPNAADWTGQLLEEEESTNQGGESPGIAIPGYPSVNITANTKNVRIALLNPEGNPCYFTFELVLKNTGESLYTSKLVPPGKAVTDLTLSRGLAVGNYDAVIKITTSSLSDQSPMNSANVETMLIVK